MISAFKVKRIEIIQSRLSTHLNPLNKDLPVNIREQRNTVVVGNISLSDDSSNRVD